MISIEVRAYAAGDERALGSPGTWDQSAQGDRSRVAVRDGRVIGAVGTVLAPPWMYIWPLVTDDDEAAAVLLEVALGFRGDDVTTARIGVRSGEEAKRRAVIARGFTPSIQFHELVHTLGERAGEAASSGAGAFERVGHADLDREAARALNNLAFEGIDNSAPLDADDFAQLLDGPTAWPDATAVWRDADGALAGFAIALRGEDERGRFGVLEAIGVAPGARKRGLARAMTDWFLGRARTAGMTEARSLVASTNTGSLALHRAAGFVEAGRRQMYDLTAV